MEIEYVGSADIREISKKNFTDNGIDNGAIRIDVSKTRRVEVSAEAGRWLVENDSGFKEVSGSESGDGQASDIILE